MVHATLKTLPNPALWKPRARPNPRGFGIPNAVAGRWKAKRHDYILAETQQPDIPPDIFGGELFQSGIE